MTSANKQQRQYKNVACSGRGLPHLFSCCCLDEAIVVFLLFVDGANSVVDTFSAQWFIRKQHRIFVPNGTTSNDIGICSKGVWTFQPIEQAASRRSEYWTCRDRVRNRRHVSHLAHNVVPIGSLRTWTSVPFGTTPAAASLKGASLASLASTMLLEICP
jgi:hypothetical protein